ncbi:MAG: hypothetical protein ACE5HB_01315, partial [Terriglobia bacterium]
MFIRDLPRRTLGFLALLPFLLPLNAVTSDCTECHEVNLPSFAASAHGFLSCVDCHGGGEEFPHPEGVRQTDCEVCHSEVVEQYAASIHARVRANGAQAPTCVTCHGDIHALISSSDPRSPVHPARLPDSCGSCHANPEMATRFGLLFTRPLEAYRASVHARAVTEGREGPTCNDCHTSHAILPGADPRSTVYPSRVPETCGGCHQEIAATYARSIHGIAVARGVHEAPVCTDCHGEHRILSPREPGSPVFPTNIPLQTCGRCHGDIRLSDKFGLPHDKVPAYEDSYHGLAARAGVQSVANCASCHGVHDILPSSDPRSHVHPANLPQTCGQCHPGAGSRFSLGPVHVVATEAEFPAAYYVRLFYLPLILLTIGAMVLHNLLDLLRKARSPALRTQAGGHTAPERMSLGFRVAHGLVMVSFALLVYTGFALTYPESWWARPVIGWEGSLGLRGLVHRVSAVVLLAAFGFHLTHLWRSRRARACIARMRPGREDWHELKQRLRYYLGRSREMPRSGKLGYVEKSE